MEVLGLIGASVYVRSAKTALLMAPRPEKKSHGREGDPTSLHPLTFDEAMEALSQPIPKATGSSSEDDRQSEKKEPRNARRRSSGESCPAQAS